ncbi:phosphotransferase [Cellulomonas endophytica]|uniref:phosphotransferase n=1 Tax=Cellulomonas endophytica TaxID=2494735 RepID=UPI0010102A58|nr:phosphotransferase [Cellulomonas endophytica]
MSLDVVSVDAPVVPAPAPHAAPVADPFATPSLRALVGAPDPLPLPAASWGAAEALLALDEARLALDLHLPDPQVVSALTTVVLRAGAYAVKVFAPGTDPGHVARVADALAGSRTAVLPVAAPVVTSWGVVSVQPWLVATGTADWAATGRLLRRFHAAHAHADLPTWVPLRRLEPQLAGLPEGAADVLLAARDTLLDELSTLHLPLGVGAVHGDVSPMNVLRHGRRHLLIDLDFAARGPREYDLSSAARRADAGEIDPVTYLDFCRAYGHDVRAWEGRVVLDRIALLGGVAFRLWDDRRQGRDLGWLAPAVADWRTPL